MSEDRIQIQFIPSSQVPADVQRQAEHASGNVIRHDERIYLKRGEQFLVFEDSPLGEEMIRWLNGDLLNSDRIQTKEQAWQKLLYGTDDAAVRFLKTEGFRQLSDRCVTVFVPCQNYADRSGLRLFAEIAPIDPSDQIVFLADGGVALIMERRVHTEEEIAEFVSAMIETMESEAGQQWNAGIGGFFPELAEMYRSFREAKKALETGLRFRRSDHVFEFRKMALERMMETIPNDTVSTLKREFMNPRVRKLMTDDMKETIETFFDQDLNLSLASRQLFIHRNTLIYRLEKIKKETGLDLRRFHDAVVFRVLMNLPDEKTGELQ